MERRFYVVAIFEADTMQIADLRIENFRGIKTGYVRFGAHTVFVGPNNCAARSRRALGEPQPKHSFQARRVTSIIVVKERGFNHQRKLYLFPQSPRFTTTRGPFFRLGSTRSISSTSVKLPSQEKTNRSALLTWIELKCSTFSACDFTGTPSTNPSMIATVSL